LDCNWNDGGAGPVEKAGEYRGFAVLQNRGLRLAGRAVTGVAGFLQFSVEFVSLGLYPDRRAVPTQAVYRAGIRRDGKKPRLRRERRMKTSEPLWPRAKSATPGGLVAPGTSTVR